MTQDEINRLRTLMSEFHRKGFVITDDQLRIVYSFLFDGEFYPIKEKLAVRNSVIETILYLKNMVQRKYSTLTLLEHYYKAQHVRLDNMFRNIERGE